MKAIVCGMGRGVAEPAVPGATLPRLALAALAAFALTACGSGQPANAAGGKAGAAATAGSAASSPGDSAVGVRAIAQEGARGPGVTLPPNELGVIPVLEYHELVPVVKGQFERPPARFRQDLEELYKRGYRPVNMSDVIDRKIQQLPRGISPVVFTFDDASPSQFSFVGSPGHIDPNSAIGIWLDFQKTHPDWADKGTFCMLPAATVGHAFFGDKGIDGQQTAWRLVKVKWLADHGFELCDHTLWHARLDKYPDAMVQEQIARGGLAIDSAVPGYKIRTFALPLGMWPRNKPLAWEGAWTNPRNGQAYHYHFDSILEVAGTPNANPFAPGFDPHHIHRQIMSGNALENTLNHLEKTGPGGRYISDGNPGTVAKPPAVTAAR